MPTTPPVISPLPGPVPSTSDPATFNARGDATLGALPALITQHNAASAATYANAVEALSSANAATAKAAAAATSEATALGALANVFASPGTAASSTTSLTIGTGEKQLDIQTGKAIAVGQSIVIESKADPRNWMLGTVTAYSSSGTYLAVTVTAVGGAGTFASWDVRLLGALPVNARQGQSLSWDNGRPVWGERVRRLGSSRNINPHSSDFSAWAPGSGGSIVSNVTTGPYGSNDASEVVSSGSGQTHGHIVKNLPETFSAGLIYTMSVFAKRGNSDGFAIDFVFGIASVPFSCHALSGMMVPFGSLATNHSRWVLDYGSIDAGHGWFRYFVTIVCPVEVAIPQIVLTAGDHAALFSAPINGNFTRFFGAQAQPGRLGAYVPTSGSSASGGGIRAKNLLKRSLEADTADGSFLTYGGSTRVGRVLSPSGALDATRYSGNGSGAYQTLTVEPNSRYTLTAWIRASALKTLGGEILYAGKDSGDISLVVSPTNFVDTEWRRFSLQFTTGPETAAAIYLGLYIGNPINGPGYPNHIDIWNVRVTKGDRPAFSAVNRTALVSEDGPHELLTLNTRHAVDSAAGAIVVEPPEVMRPGDWFEIADDGGAAATHPITLLRGPYPAIDGAAEDFVIDVERWSGRFTFDPARGLVVT